jgi:hypothetical protein
MMHRPLWTAMILVAALVTRASAQRFAPGYVDPAPVLAAAAAEIGESTLRCVTYSGTGYSGAVGRPQRTR